MKEEVMIIQKALYYVPDIFLLIIFPTLVIMALPIKNNESIFILGLIALLWIIVSSSWLKRETEILGGPIVLGCLYLRKTYTKRDSTNQLVKKRA